VKGFAFTGTSRLPAAPEVPTTDEAGLPEFHSSVWNAIWAPKGTPKPILDTLDHALQVAVASPGFKARMADLSSFPATAAGATPEGLRTHLKSELELWATVIKQAGVVPE